MQPKPAPAPTIGGLSRILVVDVLRGFALLGIIINHIISGYLAGPPPPDNEGYNILSAADGVVNGVGMLLTFGKFFTIFSFLFGLSFAIQMENASRRPGSFTGRFAWRLLILFAIGYVHNLFYSGDILVVYAALGLLLLPARFLSGKLLLPLALLLLLNAPGLVQDLIKFAEGAAPAGPPEGMMQAAAEQYRIKQSGSLSELVRMNAVDGLVMKGIFQVISGRLWTTFGLFLLGMYAWRKRVFVYNEENNRFFKKLLRWSGGLTLPATAAALAFGNPFGGASSLLQVLGNFCFGLHQALLSAFYVSAVVLLYWRASEGGLLRHLAPVGKIGLSTYLIQSVFGLLVFYGIGLGLMGHIGAAASVALGIAFFALQVLFSRWWVARFQYGLVEWVWRSLTYLKVQPLLKKAKPDFHNQQPAPVVKIVDAATGETIY